MRALVAASLHWMDADAIREKLIELPVSATVVVSNRTGGDTAVVKIAEEDLAFHVETVESGDSFKRSVMKILSEGDIDCAYFFVIDSSEDEHALARAARAARIDTHVVTSKNGVF